jgi:pimeloyl-ACP methyl ester carboxylesterase
VILDALEPRLLFSTIDTSSVSLYSANGTPGAKINRHMALVVMVHGDNMDESLMTDMATAVQDELPANQYQVLLLNWGQLAYAQTNAAKNGLAVGTTLAAMIQKSHIPVSRVNLIGYSMGGTVIGRAAKDLKTRTSEVHCIIGIDAAAGRYEPPAYAQDASYSITFCGNDTYGGTIGSLSADDSVLLTNLSSNELYRHADVFTALNNIWDRDSGEISSGDQAVSSLFSVSSILQGRPVAWKKDGIDGDFEASMACNGDDSNPLPSSLTYINSRNHTITVE